jgi:hypothetical protein
MNGDESKAVQAVAEATTKGLDSADKLGGFLSRVFGTVPEDVVGVLGGDWLHHVRLRNAASLLERTHEILRDRGIDAKTQSMSPSVGLPLLQAAQDETRDELKELWARLLANGMDPTRTKQVRLSIITAVKQFDPLDAVVLTRIAESPSNLDRMIAAVGAPVDEILVSFLNLFKIGCIVGLDPVIPTKSIAGQVVDASPLGREILRACSL